MATWPGNLGCALFLGKNGEWKSVQIELNLVKARSPFIVELSV